MNLFERALIPEIPIADACEYFLKLKYGSAGPIPSEETVLREFSSLSKEAQAEILKEAGVEQETTKTASANILPGTEHHHSPRMRAVLENLPVKTYSYEEKLASAFKVALDQNPEIQQYLAQEREGMAAQEQNESSYLRQKMQAMQQQMAMSQQGQDATSAQMAQLEQQIQSSQQQIQMAQQSAMQAQSMATQAQQGQLSATDEAMRNAQLAAQMRMAYQQLRSQMMDVASQDPAADLAAQLKGQMPGAQGLGPEAVSMGQPPTDGAPSPETGPAGQATGAASAPGAAPPEGEESAQNPANADGKKLMMQNAAPASQADIKQASAGTDALLGAGVGGALGGLGVAAESRLGSGPARKKVEQLEQQEGGFGHAVNLAQAKMRLALSEVAEKHPVAATLGGSLMGASIGMGAAPAARHLFGK